VPVGVPGRHCNVDHLPPPRNADQRLPIDAVGLGLLVIWWGAAGDAGPGQGPGLVRLDPIVALALVAAIGFVLFLVWELTNSIDRRPDAVSSTQLLDQHARHIARVRLLRQRRAAAAMVATVHGIHRDTGRPGAGARRSSRDRADPDRRSHRAACRSTHIRHAFLPHVRTGQFHAGPVRYDASFAALLVPTVIQGRRWLHFSFAGVAVAIRPFGRSRAGGIRTPASSPDYRRLVPAPRHRDDACGPRRPCTIRHCRAP